MARSNRVEESRGGVMQLKRRIGESTPLKNSLPLQFNPKSFGTVIHHSEEERTKLAQKYKFIRRKLL